MDLARALFLLAAVVLWVCAGFNAPRRPTLFCIGAACAVAGYTLPLIQAGFR